MIRFPLLSVDKYNRQARISGRPVFSGTLPEAVELLLRVPAPAAPQLVITPNVDQINRLIQDDQWRDEFAQAEVLVVDGAPVVGLFRMLGAKQINRVTGADLLPAVVSAATPVHRIAIAGGNDSVRERAIAKLRSTHPNADVVGISIPFSADPRAAADTLAELRAAAPSIVFVCLGSPKQERWVLHHRDELPGAWYVGAGAAVDFAAGEVKRAPQMLQKFGLEWLYRLSQEPRRLAKRYLVIGPLFLPVALCSLLHHFTGLCGAKYSQADSTPPARQNRR